MTSALDIPVSRDAGSDADAHADVNAALAEFVPHASDASPAPIEKSASPVIQAAGQSTMHESARAQVTGAAPYVDDIPEVKGTLYAAPICRLWRMGACSV